ncbi:hypothetical protein ACO0RG_001208 [Hanseniaspora osmophila]
MEINWANVPLQLREKLCEIHNTKYNTRFTSLDELIQKIRGGLIKIQGSWLPFDVCLELCSYFCYSIRFFLIPLFGNDFPQKCEQNMVHHFDLIIHGVITESIEKIVDNKDKPGIEKPIATKTIHKFENKIVKLLLNLKSGKNTNMKKMAKFKQPIFMISKKFQYNYSMNCKKYSKFDIENFYKNAQSPQITPIPSIRFPLITPKLVSYKFFLRDLERVGWIKSNVLEQPEQYVTMRTHSPVLTTSHPYTLLNVMSNNTKHKNFKESSMETRFAVSMSPLPSVFSQDNYQYVAKPLPFVNTNGLLTPSSLIFQPRVSEVSVTPLDAEENDSANYFQQIEFNNGVELKSFDYANQPFGYSNCLND